METGDEEVAYVEADDPYPFFFDHLGESFSQLLSQLQFCPGLVSISGDRQSMDRLPLGGN